MSKVGYTSALPSGGRALELKKKINIQLFESLNHITGACANLLPEIPLKKLKNIIAAASSFPPLVSAGFPVFVFYLLNNVLLEHALREDLMGLQKVIDHWDILESKKEYSIVIPYNDPVLPSAIWPFIEKAILRHIISGTFIEAPPEKNFSNSKKTVEQAFDLIKKTAQDHYEELVAFISNVLIVHSNNVRAGSSFDFLTLIYLRDDLDMLMVVEYLIHELAHQYIYSLSTFDSLCTGTGLFPAPLRKDKRPIEGIYHATFVLARMIHFYRQALAKDIPEFREILADKLENYVLRYRMGYDVAKENGTFTDLGWALLESSREMVG